MLKNTITVTYEEILSIRRSLRHNVNRSNILIYSTNEENSYYELFLSVNNLSLYTQINQSDDILHFETNVKQFCNKIDIPDMQLIASHDFTNTSNWLFGSSNSFFFMAPQAGKEFVFHSILGKLNKNISFTTDQSFHFVLWQSVTEDACPAVGSSPTAFGDVLYNPMGGAFTGWYKVYPAAGQNQKPNIWWYFINNVHTYTVTEFVFKSVDDFIEQARYSYEENTVRLSYEYKEFSGYLNLRSSRNERAELYTNDNQPITNPVGQTTSGILSCVVLNYDEF